MLTPLIRQNYGLFLFLLLMPFLVIRFFCLIRWVMIKNDARLFGLVVLSYIGIFIISVNLPILLNGQPPEFEDANVFTGAGVSVWEWEK